MSHDSVILRRSPVSTTEALWLSSDRCFPRHSHDQYGVGLLSHGAQRSFSGRGVVEAQAGDVIMVNPGEIHDGQPLHGRGRSWQMLYFDPSRLHNATEQPFDTEIDSLNLLPPVSQDQVLASLIRQLLAALRDGDDALAIDEAEVRLFALLRQYPQPPAAGRTVTASLERVRQRLHDTGAHPLRLPELAQDCGLSQYQLLRQFYRQHGITPHAYLVQRRLQAARQLLHGNTALAEVALQCGFADQSHLTRAFKRQFGLTPGHYRQAGRARQEAVYDLAGQSQTGRN